MESVPSPHENWKLVLLSGRIERGHFEQFASLLSAIHRGGARSELCEEFRDRSFFELRRIEPLYLVTAERVPAARPFLDALVDATRAQCVILVHGDYSPKNILVHEGRLVLLDHEMIHFGDPEFDVGFSMAHLLSKANHVKAAQLALAAAAQYFWEVYLECGSLAEENRSVRHSLGCLLAGVAGRSPPEYLDERERICQQNAALVLMGNPPQAMSELIARFVACVQPSSSL